MNAMRGTNVYPPRAETSTSETATPDLPFKGSDSGGGDGGMDDILRRLHTVETTVSDIRTDVSALTAAIPHLATKADVAELRGNLEADIAEVKGSIEADIAELKGSIEADIAELKGSLKADIAEVKGGLESDIAEVKGGLEADIAEVKGSIAHLESALIKWIVGTTLAVATLAFAIARFVAPAGV